ncbi:MAG: molybdenum cofactor guanylyltransferase [Infirmifilum sp.]
MEVALLAGGFAKRLGGMYKPLIRICDKPVLAALAMRLSSAFEKIIVVVHTKEQEELVSSALANIPGEIIIAVDEIRETAPIVGLYTAARNSTTSAFAVLPADVPFLKAETILNILKNLETFYDAVVPKWPNGYLEPLIASYRREALIRALNGLDNYGKSVTWLLAKLRTKYVDINALTPHPNLEFFNLNTPEDLAKAEEICRRLDYY